MALSMLNCRVGSIVDHAWTYNAEDRTKVQKDKIRRGIIVRVEGQHSDAISGLYVKFKTNEEPEKVLARELDLALPATTRIAKEAYRRVMGLPKHVGAEFNARKPNPRRRVEDSLAIGNIKTGSEVVKPEIDSEDEEPLVVGLESLKDSL